MGPIKGQQAHIVDEDGATFAFPTAELAATALENERQHGAENLTAFTVTVPRDGMTWDDVADHACSYGPDVP